MQQYLDLLKKIYTQGYPKAPSRPGLPPVKELNSQVMQFDLSQGFPILTTKFISLNLVAAELHWFLSGSTNIFDLWKYKCHFWDKDAFKFFKHIYNIDMPFSEWQQHVQNQDTLGTYTYGDCGHIYGYQWRHFNSSGRTVDQIAYLEQMLKTRPESRYLIVNAWNPADFDNVDVEAALPACHTFFQVFLHGNKLDLTLYQRSADMFLGVPYNISSYSLLLWLLCQMFNYELGTFTWFGGACHIYENHFEQVEKILQRTPKPLPDLSIKHTHNHLWEYAPDDFELVGYDHYSKITAPLSVGV